MTFSRSAIQIRLYQGLRRIVLLLSATFYKKTNKRTTEFKFKTQTKNFFYFEHNLFFLIYSRIYLQ